MQFVIIILVTFSYARFRSEHEARSPMREFIIIFISDTVSALISNLMCAAQTVNDYKCCAFPPIRNGGAVVIWLAHRWETNYRLTCVHCASRSHRGHFCSEWRASAPLLLLYYSTFLRRWIQLAFKNINYAFVAVGAEPMQINQPDYRYWI